MKRNIITLILALLLVPALAGVTHAKFVASHKEKRRISVTGDAEVRVVPDQVLISMTVETRGKALLSTKQENDTAIRNIIAYIVKEEAIDKKHVRTDYTSVAPRYFDCHYDSMRKGTCDPLNVIFFRVRKGVQVRLNDLDKYEDIITKSLELGVTSIDDIKFITTELRKHKDRARALAAKAAREKATDVAKALGMKVLKPVSVTLNSSNWYYWNGAHNRGRGGGASQNAIQSVSSGSDETDGDSLALGQININAQVHASFEIE